MYTAIIHLREPVRPGVRGMVESMLRLLRGVHDATCEPSDRLITISFDDGETSLADLVRAIEDAGSAVSGVAQRPLRSRLAPRRD